VTFISVKAWMGASLPPKPSTILPLRDRLRGLLTDGRFEEIAEAAARKKSVLGRLVPNMFDPDPQIGWRAVEATGLAADRIARTDPDYVRQHLRRLHWLLSEESGGLCWRAPEGMAEIVSRNPRLFADYIPIVTSLIVSMAEEDLEHFRVGALWAIGRLGMPPDGHDEEVLGAVVSALDNEDSQVRGMAVWCLEKIGMAKLLAERGDLLSDDGLVELYEDGTIRRTTVGEMVEALLAAS
jgi:hypothetical protein